MPWLSRHRKHRSQKGVSELSQLPLVLYFLFLIALLPLLNVVNLLVAGTTQYLATNDVAAKASSQADFTSALNSLLNEAYQFQSTGLAKFVNLDPEGGYTGCGDDLYVLATNISSGTVTSSSADQPLGQTIDTSANMYEFQVKSTYSISPLVSLAAVPVLGNVPGLGTPITLTFTANRPVENPSGLRSAPTGSVTNSAVTPFPRIASSSVAPAPPTADTWRTPSIFNQIQNAGQSVVQVNVVKVPANVDPLNPLNPWYATGINVQPGQSVWIDTQATGTWGWGASTWDANGLTSSIGVIDGKLPAVMLIGYVGNNPPMYPYVGYDRRPTDPCLICPNGGPNFIPSGNSLLNYPVTIPGPISLACNDDDHNDFGYQMVRVVIAQ